MSTRDDYVAALKTAAISIGKKAVMGSLISACPVLAAPFLYPLVDFIVGKILTIAIDQTEMGAFFLYIDLRVASQSKDFELAAYKNHEAQKNGTEEEKKKAEADLIKKFNAFVVLTS
ncbi:MAG: hypothetical protein ACXVB1_00025 [Pseudobdellovibrionaceae bacterium]